MNKWIWLVLFGVTAAFGVYYSFSQKSDSTKSTKNPSISQPLGEPTETLSPPTTSEGPLSGVTSAAPAAPPPPATSNANPVAPAPDHPQTYPVPDYTPPQNFDSSNYPPPPPPYEGEPPPPPPPGFSDFDEDGEPPPPPPPPPPIEDQN